MEMTTDERWAEVLKFRRRLLSAARVPKSVVRRGTEGNGLENQAFGEVSRLPTRRMMSRATAVGEPTLVAGERGVVIVVTKGCGDDESRKPKSRIGKPIRRCGKCGPVNRCLTSLRCAILGGRASPV